MLSHNWKISDFAPPQRRSYSSDITEPLLSIVVPVRHETALATWFLRLCLRQTEAEIVVVDTSAVQTLSHSPVPRARILHRPELNSRASAMNEGARASRGVWILFLHADCELPINASTFLQGLANEDIPGGAFLKKYVEASFLVRFQSLFLNRLAVQWRRGIVGTNAIFIRRVVFEEIGGFPHQSILEDVALWKKLRQKGSIVLPTHVEVSGRRYKSWLGIPRIIGNAVALVMSALHFPPSAIKFIYERWPGGKR